MKLYLSKYRRMRFSRGRDNPHFYTFKGCKLELLHAFLELGIFLSFEAEFPFLLNKAHGVLAFIKRWVKEFKNLFINKTLHMSLMLLILEYGTLL